MLAKVDRGAPETATLAAMFRGEAGRRLVVATMAIAMVVGGFGVDGLSIASALGHRAGVALASDEAAPLRKAITINRSPRDVYAYWRDFTNAPHFMREVESVRITGDRRSRWRARGPAGIMLEWDTEIVEDRPGQYIAWRSSGGLTGAGSVLFSRAPRDQGTEVRVSMEYTLPAGMIGATVARILGQAPEQALEEGLHRLKHILETGEVLVSERQPTDAGQPTVESGRPGGRSQRRR